MSVRNQEPNALWNHFADLNAVPRPSKKEERVIEFMLNFGKELNLETIKDEIGNVIIKKPASPGMENRKKVILQSHLDMVHQKNADTEFDFINKKLINQTFLDKGGVDNSYDYSDDGNLKRIALAYSNITKIINTANNGGNI